MSEAITPPENKPKASAHRDCFADDPDPVAAFWARERVEVSIDRHNWGFPLPPVEEAEIGF